MLDKPHNAVLGPVGGLFVADAADLQFVVGKARKQLAIATFEENGATGDVGMIRKFLGKGENRNFGDGEDRAS